MIRPPRSGRTSIAQRLAAILTAPMLVAACGNLAGPFHPGSVASAQPTPAPGTSPTRAPSATHVFVIIMENRSYSQAIKGSYTAQLATEYAQATNYHAVAHPSLPNYLALTSGSTWGVADDGFHVLAAGGLGAELDSAGVSWRAYMEGMSSNCLVNGNGYALKHDPFAYYGGHCPSQVVPYSQLSTDLAGDVPRFVWITPNLCHDGHDCSTAVADAWLAEEVPSILASNAWKDGGVLFITWDEGTDSANSVLTLVIHPRPVLHRSGQEYDHYSLLATIEDALGVPRLGSAVSASAMSGLMVSWPLLRPASTG